jgi:hypothetical protein
VLGEFVHSVKRETGADLSYGFFLCLCCPRNGKQVSTRQQATVSNHGKAMCYTKRIENFSSSLELVSPETGLKVYPGDAAGGAS